jgi:hypothetical protein
VFFLRKHPWQNQFKGWVTSVSIHSNREWTSCRSIPRECCYVYSILLYMVMRNTSIDIPPHVKNNNIYICSRPHWKVGKLIASPNMCLTSNLTRGKPHKTIHLLIITKCNMDIHTNTFYSCWIYENDTFVEVLSICFCLYKNAYFLRNVDHIFSCAN